MIMRVDLCKPAGYEEILYGFCAEDTRLVDPFEVEE
jgi:hypothetical protein